MDSRHRRLSRLCDPPSGRSVIVPVDDSLIFGPRNGLADFDSKLRDIADGAPQAILGYPGHFEHHSQAIQSLAWICNLTASTTRRSHTRKTQIISVRDAIALGCDCVAAHVNLTSAYETEMLHVLSRIV